MATIATTTRWQPVTPWWERSKAPWKGMLFDRMILKPDDPREQRIQLARQEVMHRPEGKRGRLSTQRARLLTESYQQTEGQSAVTRRAKAFYHVLANIPIPISKYSLLSGSPAAVINGMEYFPEHSSWAEREVVVNGQRMTELESLPVRTVDPIAVADEDRRILQDKILPYWRGRTLNDFQVRYLEAHCPESLRHIENAQVIKAGIGGTLSHTVQDYRSVLEKGMRGLIEDMRGYMAELDLAYPTEGVRTFERREFYEAMILVAEGVIRYAERAAEEAEKQAAQEPDPQRAAELREMARISRKVPAGPADTFAETIQSLHLCHMITALTEGGASHSGGRLDQYLYPYLKADLAAGRITKAGAQELMECLWLKFYEYMTPRSSDSVAAVQGFHANDKITIGGTDEFGRDVSNEMTYMALEAQAHIHLSDPVISLRLHKNTPDDLLRCALEVIRLGGGIPQLLSDEVIVPGLVATAGVSLEDARHHADIGCQENCVDPNSAPSRADANPHSNTGWYNLAKPIELAIWNGFNPITGKQAGPQTGDVRSFKTMEEFAAAVRVHMEEATRLNVVANNLIEYGWAHHLPCIYHSLMHPGPRRSGIDYIAGGCKYNWTGQLTVGLGTATDCMAAIDSLIYREKSVTWDELQAALKANWEGYEDVRAKCIAAPKYGTDNDLADGWGKKLLDVLFDAYESYPTTKGGKFVGGCISMGFYHTLGLQTGATPDGRVSRENLSDSVSASVYAPPMGPTAVHRSVTKVIDAIRTVNGVTFNQKFNESAVMSDRDLSKWADLVRTYVADGGQAVQYTVVNQRVLLEAQKDPDKFRDLVVRVGGFSALFVELSKEIQDSIIARAEQEV